MQFETKVEQEVAEAEIVKLLDHKEVFPKQRERLQPAIDSIVEAIMWGFVTINDDWTITQKLFKPIGPVEEIKYKDRVAADIMNKKVAELRNDNQTNRNMVYITCYTGKSANEINKLENFDRNVADSLAFFFQS